MIKRRVVDVFAEVSGHRIEMEGYFAHYSCTKCSFETASRPKQPRLYQLNEEDKSLCSCGNKAIVTRHQELSWGSVEGYIPLCQECSVKYLEDARDEEVHWLSNLKFICECE